MNQIDADSNVNRNGQESALEKRCRDLSVMLAGILGGGSEWFSRVGDHFYIDPKLAGSELQRRKTDAAITKKALFRARAEIARLSHPIKAIGASQ